MQPLYLMAMDANELEQKIIGIEQKLTKVLSLLSGNDLNNKDNGIVGTVENHEDRIADLEKWKDRFTWTLIGMGAPAAIGVLKILQEVIKIIH